MASVTTREDYAPFYVDDREYFELDTFYDEFSRPWQERRLPMRYAPSPGAVAGYQVWWQRNP